MFKEFIRLRRKWFLLVFVVTCPICIKLLSGDPAVLTIPFAIFASLVITTTISILSIPVVALLAKRKNKSNKEALKC